MNYYGVKGLRYSKILIFLLLIAFVIFWLSSTLDGYISNLICSLFQKVLVVWVFQQQRISLCPCVRNLGFEGSLKCCRNLIAYGFRNRVVQIRYYHSVDHIIEISLQFEILPIYTEPSRRLINLHILDISWFHKTQRFRE